MTRFVIDACSIGPLLIPDEIEPHGANIAALMDNADLITAPHWPLEVANMLLFAVRRGRLTDVERLDAFRRFKSLAIKIDQTVLDEAWSDCFDLAVADKLTIYDAAYLELARRHGYGLLTLDGPLARAARARGIETPLIP